MSRDDLGEQLTELLNGVELERDGVLWQVWNAEVIDRKAERKAAKGLEGYCSVCNDWLERATIKDPLNDSGEGAHHHPQPYKLTASPSILPDDESPQI